MSRALASLLRSVDWPRVWAEFKPFWAQLVGIAFIVVTAVALYKLRTYRPRYYAILEGMVAITTGWFAFSAKTATESGLKLAAAVYLLVRCFDNWNRERPPVSSRTHRTANSQSSSSRTRQ